MKIKDAIQKASKKIEYNEAKTLMKYYLNVNDEYLIIHANDTFKNKQIHDYLALVKKVREGYPLQYISNSQEFMGEKFKVDENVLIPQPDTEILVETALNIIKRQEMDNIRILDLCTGSGAIAISMAKFLKDKKVEIVASDISLDALKKANENAIEILENDSIKFVLSDLFDEFNEEEKFDIILTNPPYIRTDDIEKLDQDVQKQPRIALDGGSDGLRFYRNIRFQVEQFLKDKGYLLMEIGYDQKEEVVNLFENSTCLKDYSGNDRVVVWKYEENK